MKIESKENIFFIAIIILVICLFIGSTVLIFQNKDDKKAEIIYYECEDFKLTNQDFYNIENSFEVKLIERYQKEIDKTEGSYYVDEYINRGKKDDSSKSELNQNMNNNTDTFIEDNYAMILTKKGEQINIKYGTYFIKYVLAEKLNMAVSDSEFKIIWDRHKKHLLNVIIDPDENRSLIQYISFYSGYFYTPEWSFYIKDIRQ